MTAINVASSGGGADRGLRRRFERATSRPIVLWAPGSPDECRRRLDQVTTPQSATTWYLSSASAGRADPRLRGFIGPSWISVARWQDAAGRNHFAPRLNARLSGTADETMLTGTVGLGPGMVRLLPRLAIADGLILVAVFASGVAQLADGELPGLAFVFGPVVMALFIVALTAAGLRSVRDRTPDLIAEINAILGSAVVAP